MALGLPLVLFKLTVVTAATLFGASLPLPKSKVLRLGCLSPYTSCAVPCTCSADADSSGRPHLVESPHGSQASLRSRFSFLLLSVLQRETVFLTGALPDEAHGASPVVSRGSLFTTDSGSGSSLSLVCLAEFGLPPRDCI